LTEWKKAEYSFLKDVWSTPLQQSLKHLNTAYQRFFKKKSGYPTYKNRFSTQSASYTKNGFTFNFSDLNNPILSLHKIGKLKVKWSLKINQIPKTATITKYRDGTYGIFGNSPQI
jgi:putative transposase